MEHFQFVLVQVLDSTGSFYQLRFFVVSYRIVTCNTGTGCSAVGDKHAYCYT